MNATVGILGASGYTGAELLRILACHPRLQVQCVSAHSLAGKFVGEAYPHLKKFAGLPFLKAEEASSQMKDCELVFSALPHGESMKVLPGLKNSTIIDLGSDFRLQKAEDYQLWYQQAHSCPAELPHWTYGLPELFRSKIKNAKRIANPGCYATAITLALAPLLKVDLLQGPIRVSAASGVSGAGRQAKDAYHFPHQYENFSAYKIGAHQHTGEIEQSLSCVSGKEVLLSFTPHLLPISRGIFATIFAEANKEVSESGLYELFQSSYENEPFIDVSRSPIDIKRVRGSNRCALFAGFDKRTRTIILTSAIDNLVKGASGQAIQNANIALGFPETLGLEGEGLYP